jgi:gamma-glutamyl:cysteine ligase YbdK (ATP-grasp superfamily)
MPDHLSDWKHFVNLTEQLQKAGIIKQSKIYGGMLDPILGLAQLK